nr:MAG TPA: hypothetical protein [Caudoviricetes sp.]
MSKNIVLREAENGFEVIGKDVSLTTKARVQSATIDGQHIEYVFVPNMLYPEHRPKFVTNYKQLIGEAVENIKAGYGDFMMQFHGAIYVGEVIGNDAAAKKLNEQTMQEWADKKFKYCIETTVPGIFGRCFVIKSTSGKDKLDHVTDFPNGIITFNSYADAKKRIASYEEKAKKIIDAARSVEGSEAQYEAYNNKLNELGENFFGSVVRLVLTSMDDDWTKMPALSYPLGMTSDFTISQIPINLKK